MANRPGGVISSRPLQFIWIADCSGSMQVTKIESLNTAIREAIPRMREVATENSQAQVMVRALKFSDGAQWHVSQPTDVYDFKWDDLNADGVTDMGKALSMAADALTIENMPERGLRPVLVLITDGQATDDFAGGLKSLMDQPWGKKAVRIAIAIGEDPDLDVLQKFIGNPEVKPLVASNAPDLANKIKWASTIPLKVAANPMSRTIDQAGSTAHVPIPAPPADITAISANDVFY